jgi:hypothetical protein
LTLGELRHAWDQVADALIQVDVEGQALWMLESQLPWLEASTDSDPVVRLLPAFDTYLLGYESRSLAVEPAYARRVHPGGGILRPVLLVDGIAKGIWKIERRRARIAVRVEPFESFPGELMPLLEAEVADLGRFLQAEAFLNVV